MSAQIGKQQIEQQEPITERRFRALLEKSRDVVALTSREMAVLYITPSIEQALGYTPDEYMQIESRLALIHPDDRVQSEALVQYVLAECGRSMTMQHRLQHKNGSYRWFEVTITNLFDDPDVGAALTNFRDVTEQKEMDETLNQTVLIFDHLFKANIVGIILADADGRIYDANDMFIHMIGYSKSELVGEGMHWQDLTPPEYQEAEARVAQQMVDDGEAGPWEKEYVRKDGSRFPALVSGAIIDSTKQLAIALILDISERKELERRKDEFLSVASHELRTPITTVKALTQLLRRQIDEQAGTEHSYYLNRIDKHINKLNKLIGDLLDASKIQAGKLDYAQEPIAIDAVVRESIETAQQITKTHTISLHGSIHATIVGDKERLEQVFVNLISNAIKYSPQAQQVEVSLATSPDTVTICIQDYGIGIPVEHQSKIFDRFYRVSDGRAALFPGLGMGLYISHEIITRHGGTITVTSSEGQGSTFTVSLPLNPPTIPSSSPTHP